MNGDPIDISRTGLPCWTDDSPWRLCIHTDLEAAGFDRIVPKDASLDIVAHGVSFGEGPVWAVRDRCFYYVDIIGDTIWKYTPGVDNQVVIRPSHMADGMTLDLEGRLVVAGWGSRTVWRGEHDGSLVPLARTMKERN